jgi:hypothetical protein
MSIEYLGSKCLEIRLNLEAAFEEARVPGEAALAG